MVPGWLTICSTRRPTAYSTSRCELPARWVGFPDLDRAETTVLAVLLGLVVAIGIYPRWLLALIGGAASALAGR